MVISDVVVVVDVVQQFTETMLCVAGVLGVCWTAGGWRVLRKASD